MPILKCSVFFSNGTFDLNDMKSVIFSNNASFAATLVKFGTLVFGLWCPFSANLCPRLRLRRKLHWWAIDQKLWAAMC